MQKGAKEPVNTVLVKRDLLNSLKADREYRHAWNFENVYTGLCFQLRALREQRGLSQAALGKEAGMAQERISILEDPNAPTKPTLTTLLRIADAHDVGLEVKFIPYSSVIESSINTQMESLEVPSFDEELPMLESSLQEALAQAGAEDKAEGKPVKISPLPMYFALDPTGVRVDNGTQANNSVTISQGTLLYRRRSEGLPGNNDYQYVQKKPAA